SLDRTGSISIEKLYSKEQFIRNKIVENFPITAPCALQLLQASDQFLISSPHATRIQSGYPWSSEGIANELRALPGLCLVTGRFPEAKEMLVDFVEQMRQAASVRTQRNFLEQVLWFFWSVQKYLEHSGDFEFIRMMHPHLLSFYQCVRNGVAGYFRMADDGLISIDDPHHRWFGKSAAIQALWYNALQFLEELEIKMGGKRKRYKDLALRVRDSFNQVLVDETMRYVHTRYADGKTDRILRAEALLAMSLPYPVLDQKYYTMVFDTAWQYLYTSYGLREWIDLQPTARHITETPTHDQAGAIRPVWIGVFITAYFKIYGTQASSKAQARQFIDPFEKHLDEMLIGSISEAFDAEWPYGGQGCPSCALSVAEVLRVLVEEIGLMYKESSYHMDTLVSSPDP
ncbi:MAG: hypothetical protein GF384_04765, partial [Elusimicrobia bacterium]|nr:hypothetical protein [Elusimicrobiota bacterium]MBD3412136.1 hypothetical protein [Elusimicrobiota bacterium]